jgi:hypothetical protein
MDSLSMTPVKCAPAGIAVLVVVMAMTGLTPAWVAPVQATLAAGNVYTTGSIYVSSTPGGASAILDGGEDQLVTTGTFTSVTPGSHNVKIMKPGYQPYSMNVVVSVGKTSNIIVTLSQATLTGGLSVSSTPKGAGLYIDDLFQGNTDQIVGNLAPGPHLVAIKTAGYLPWSQTVSVVDGQILPVKASLVPESNPDTGDLHVMSAPSGAAVYLNGDFQGVTPLDGPLDIIDLSPGSYMVILRKSGYLDYSTSTAIQAGREVRIDAALQPASISPAEANAEILSSPSGADVYINNEYMGVTPLSFPNVAPGIYTIDIRLAGYVPYSTTGTVTAGKDIQIIAALSPLSATPSPGRTYSPTGLSVTILGALLAGIFVSLRSRR